MAGHPEDPGLLPTDRPGGASGVFTVTGTSTARCAIFWAAIVRSPTTHCIAAWTSCWRTSKGSSRSFARVGRGLFEARFDVLLYDLTSTYFESDPPFEGKRRFGYSRDQRPDCVQVVIALIVTPEGFLLAYEVMAGNTADQTTLAGFLEKIERHYGRSDRVWIMDRGIPTEEDRWP